jgi:preprotein translocase subunit SecY
MIECDMGNAEDRGLFTSASKAFTIVLTGVQAAAYIVGGMYGALPGTTAVIVFLQLMGAGVVVLLMDELVQKGWGFGSGVSLFIMAGVAKTVFWDAFSPAPAVGQSGAYGLFVQLGGSLGNSTSLSNLWLRQYVNTTGALVSSNPTLLGFVATIISFFVIIYMEGVRIELPLSYAGYKGYRSRYPIKLLYVSNLPVIFASALFANVYFFSQLFWSMSGQPAPGANPWLDILGQFKVVGTSPSQTITPIGGIVYYVTAPSSWTSVAQAPWQALGYLGILIVFCVIFSLTWLEVGGIGPSNVAQQLMDAGMQIPGYRRSGRAIESILKRYIPAVTVVGGILVGLLAGLSDFFGVFGTGIGILLSVGIIYQYYETLMQERAAEMYPAFRRLFGE